MNEHKSLENARKEAYIKLDQLGKMHVDLDMILIFSFILMSEVKRQLVWKESKAI